jgi:ABC-type amino acid transport substrate-binding protein
MRQKALILLITLCAFALTGPIAAPVRDGASSAANSTMNICANPEALPYTAEESTVPGFQIELHRAIAAALGRNPSVTWVYNRIAGKRLNCGGWMSRIVTTNMRATPGQQLTEPYMGTGLVIVRKPGASTQFESLPALLAEPEFRSGAHMGIALGAWIGSVVEGNGVKTIGYVEQRDIIDGVLRGEVAAGIVRREDVAWYLRQSPGSLAVIDMYKLDPNFRWDVAIGLRQSTPELLAQINGVLARFRTDGTLQAMTEKYGIPYLPPFMGR